MDTTPSEGFIDITDDSGDIIEMSTDFVHEELLGAWGDRHDFGEAMSIVGHVPSIEQLASYTSPTCSWGIRHCIQRFVNMSEVIVRFHIQPWPLGIIYGESEREVDQKKLKDAIRYCVEYDGCKYRAETLEKLLSKLTHPDEELFSKVRSTIIGSVEVRDETWERVADIMNRLEEI